MNMNFDMPQGQSESVVIRCEMCSAIDLLPDRPGADAETTERRDRPMDAVIILLGGFLYLITAGALVPWVAQQKGRSGFGWFLIALFWTPLFALIALAAVPDKLGPVVVTVEPPELDEAPEFKWRKG
jgi:hypothetical protein